MIRYSPTYRADSYHCTSTAAVTVSCTLDKCCSGWLVGNPDLNQFS